MTVQTRNGRLPAAKSYARLPDVLPLPHLIEVQLVSFRWFQTEGLRELFDEISPIVSFNRNLELHFGDFWFGEPKYPERECRDRDMTYAAPLWVKTKLVNKETGEITEQDVFMGDFPLMTESGTFIYNGAERVVVSQLIRSPGVYFTVEEDRATGRELCFAKLIPSRGAWLEFETSKRDVLSVKVDRKRKLPVTVFLRAIGYGTDDEIRELFAEVDNVPEHPYIDATLERDPTSITATGPEASRQGVDAALLEFYKRLRPGDPPTLDNARNFLQNLLFVPRRYDLGRVGRYKLNRRLDLAIPQSQRTLTNEDIVSVVRRMIQINNGVFRGDDIDHLGNRRVKTVGELIQNQLRIGLLRMERVVRERMSIREPGQLTPLSLINIRPVVAAIREFFGGSQLSQFMDQTNPLAELTHKRRLSALGPGGLRRERAGFDVRDVHHSHYGRICPIETPEGPNIGLIGSLATYGRVNEFGFIETPYRRVKHEVPAEESALIGRTLRQDIVDPATGETIARTGTVIDADTAALICAVYPPVEVAAEESALIGRTLCQIVADPETGEVIAHAGAVVDAATARRIAALYPAGGGTRIKVAPDALIKVAAFATDEIVFLTADEEERHAIAQASSALNERGEFTTARVSVRRGEAFLFESPDTVDYMDVSPKQIVSVSAALIPFLEHDDANRALMGSNMQRQAVPLLSPEAPLVGTGMEYQAAFDSGQVVVAEKAGEVISATSEAIVVQEDDGTCRRYPLRKFNRSNQSTCIDERPVVFKGQRVQQGDVLADSSSTQEGHLALGQNVLCAFMSWEGGNYEDAILISERLVWEDKFSSIHIEKHEVEARDTKLGPEEITRDIPNVGEEALKDLDEEGIIRIGAEVGPGDILVGKITPKGETELSPEEKLLRAIFGEKAREVKDSSLRLPHGEHGKVVDVRVFGRDEYRDLPAGVEKMVRVSVAQRRKLSAGDKMAGRHGNKGVISKIVPIEDMPFLEDGTPIDIILNPLGVPARMNIGQILETHLGWAADRLGFRVITPVFDPAPEQAIEAELARAWLIDKAWAEITERAWKMVRTQGLPEDSLVDDEEARLLYITEWLQDRSDYDMDRIVQDRVYRRRSVLREWLRERGYDPESLLSFEDDPRPLAEREQADQRARLVCAREWIRHYEDLIRAHGLDPSNVADADLLAFAEKASKAIQWPLPTTGKQRLYDGKTGEPFDQPVTVGVINMMKLAHLVEDKVHARSTGPYSLVTQQPLGGKAQFGGQRFGEMEVWALEAYGAAYVLQEMLTVKSDDVTGRVKTYEAIVKGEPISPPGVPESFRVLVKELQSLGLAVEVINDKREVVQFGREELEERLPKLGFSLSVPGPMAGYE